MFVCRVFFYLPLFLYSSNICCFFRTHVAPNRARARGGIGRERAELRCPASARSFVYVALLLALLLSFVFSCLRSINFRWFVFCGHVGVPVCVGFLCIPFYLYAFWASLFFPQFSFFFLLYFGAWLRLIYFFLFNFPFALLSGWVAEFPCF